MYTAFMGILYLRKGDYAAAKALEEEQQKEEFLQLLTKVANVSRSKVWKYSIESIALQPVIDAEDYKFCEQFLDIAQETGRKDLEVIARLFLAQYYSKADATDDYLSQYQKVGIPLEYNWRVIGPFVNRAGFDHRFPPEEAIDLDSTYRSDGTTVRWQSAGDGTYDGYVDLKRILKRSSWGVAYATLFVHSPDKRMVQLRLASDESCKLWLNDKLVWKAYRVDDVPIDTDIVTVVLRPGMNRLLLKITNRVGDWGFYLRVTDEKGDGIPDLEFRAPTAEEGKLAI